MSCIDNGYLFLSSQQIHMLFLEVQNNAVPKCFLETVYKKKSFLQANKNVFAKKERLATYIEYHKKILDVVKTNIMRTFHA